MTMSTALPPWPPAPLSEAKSPPDDPELVAWARETVFGVIAKYDKASETTTRDRVKHPTDVAKLTTARGRVYRALGKLRATYTSHIHDNAIEDDELHLQVAARNLAALQLLDELDRDIKALTVQQLEAAKAAANNAESQEEEEEGDENDEEQNDNPENDDDAGADHPNPDDDDATAPDNGAETQPNGRPEDDGRGQSPRDPVVAGATDQRRPKKKAAPEDDPTGAVAVLKRYLRKTASEKAAPKNPSGKQKKKKSTAPVTQHSATLGSFHSTESGDSVTSLQLKLAEQRQVNQTMAEFLEETYALQAEAKRAEAEVKRAEAEKLDQAKRAMNARVQEIRDQAAAELAALEADEKNQRSEPSRHSKRRTRSPGGPDQDPKAGSVTSNDRVRQYLSSLPKVPVTDKRQRNPTVNENPDAQGGVQTKDLLQVLLDQTYLNRIPVVEPPIFTGDPLKYHDWYQSFVTLVERRSVCQEDRLHYLKKYLAGDALDAVEGFLLLDSEDAYADAKKLLKERYGDPFTLANAYRSKLEDWPKIKGDDHRGLRKFSDFLRQCLAAKKSIGSLAVLDDDRENHKMLAKLPVWLTSRWARRVAEWQEKRENKGFPPFEWFVAFISKESNILSNPITNLHSTRADDKKEKKESQQKPARTLATDGEPEAKPKSKKSRKAKKKAAEAEAATLAVENADPPQQSRPKGKCAHCEKEHAITACPTFARLTYDRRMETVRNQRLCFRCLRAGHQSADCRSTPKCDVCQKPHVTLMHDPEGPRRPSQDARRQRYANATQYEQQPPSWDQWCKPAPTGSTGYQPPGPPWSWPYQSGALDPNATTFQPPTGQK